MADVTVRPLQSAERAAAMSLEVTHHQAHLVATARESLAAVQVFPHSEVLGVFAEERLVGMMLVQPLDGAEEGTLLMWDYFIDRRRQGRGFGKAGVRGLLVYAATLGLRSVKLSYAPANTVARDLYCTTGFVETGTMNADGEHEMLIDVDPG